MMQDIGKKKKDNVNQIENSGLNVKRMINSVNENYRNFFSANVSYHLHLRDAAERAGDMAGMMHHQVMSEIYQSIEERMYVDPRYSGSPLQ